MMMVVLVALEITLIVSVIERFRPATVQPLSLILANLAYLLLSEAARILLFGWASTITVFAVNMAGGGIIALPDRGLGFWIGTIGYIVAMDAAEFGFHVAQHKIPLLWAMHSLHHSDEGLNASTTNRHFWAESAIRAITVYVPVAVLFHVSAATLSIFAFVQHYNYFPHANLRIGLGRCSWMINSPQYHRIHHSNLPGDRDVNFAALFPVFDVVFGTYRRPGLNEYPPTGLDDCETTSNPLKMMIWPFLRTRPMPSITRCAN